VPPSSDSPIVDVRRLKSESFARFVEYFEVIPSTNDLAMRLAPDTRTETPALLVAGTQTAGRGRGSNQWWSTSGSLTFSVVIDVDDYQLPSRLWPCVALTAALSICEVLRDLIETTQPALKSAGMTTPSVGLKWPNDVWLDGKKIGGILVEVPLCRPPTAPRLVVGIGLNINNSIVESPEAVRSVGTSLCDVIGQRCDLTDVLLALLNRFHANVRALGQNDARLRAKWQSLCVLRGRRVGIALVDTTASGMCQGIQPDGSLLLETSAGYQKIYAGTVQSIE